MVYRKIDDWGNNDCDQCGEENPVLVSDSKDRLAFCLGCLDQMYGPGSGARAERAGCFDNCSEE